MGKLQSPAKEGMGNGKRVKSERNMEAAEEERRSAEGGMEKIDLGRPSDSPSERGEVVVVVAATVTVVGVSIGRLHLSSGLPPFAFILRAELMTVEATVKPCSG